MRACVHAHVCVCVKCACAFVPVRFALHDLIICCQILLDFTSDVLMSAFLFIIKYYNCSTVFGLFCNHQLCTERASGVLRANQVLQQRFRGGRGVLHFTKHVFQT